MRLYHVLTGERRGAVKITRHECSPRSRAWPHAVFDVPAGRRPPPRRPPHRVFRLLAHVRIAAADPRPAREALANARTLRRTDRPRRAFPRRIAVASGARGAPSDCRSPPDNDGHAE